MTIKELLLIGLPLTVTVEMGHSTPQKEQGNNTDICQLATTGRFILTKLCCHLA